MPAHRLGIGAVVVAVTVGLLTAIGNHSASSSGAPAAVAPERPNIVLITTDDQTLSDMKYLPRTRAAIGGHGATFTQMLSPHPLCCPARAEILTGQYAQNNGVRSNNADRHGGYQFLDNRRTIATMLKGAGYSTAFVGKYLNGYTVRDGREPGWDIWNPLTRQVYNYLDYELYEDGNPTQYHGVHQADVIGDRTDDYIRRLAPGDQPFFIWSSQVAPHNTCGSLTGEFHCGKDPVPAARHRNLFPHATSPSLRDPSFNEKNLKDKPRSIRKLGKVKVGKINQTFRQRIRSLQAVDEAVQSTVATLQETGELDNTLIAFTSDNGYLLGEHRYVRKDVPYEQALRTPLLVRGPGVPAGVTRSQTVTLVDLAPTFLDVARAPRTLVMDGRSILPVLRDNAAGHQTVLIQAGPRGKREIPAGWAFRGVRTSRYTYVWYPTDRFEELYDRRRDPAQMRNVAKSKKYAKVRKDLRARTKVLARCAGPVCYRTFR